MATDPTERLQADMRAAEECDRRLHLGGGGGGRQDVLTTLYTRAVPILARQAAFEDTRRYVANTDDGVVVVGVGVAGASAAGTAVVVADDAAQQEEPPRPLAPSPSLSMSAPTLATAAATSSDDAAAVYDGTAADVASVRRLYPTCLLPMRPQRTKRVYQKRSRGPANPGLKSVPIDVMRERTSVARHKGRLDTLADGRPLEEPLRKRLRLQVRLNAQIQKEQELVVAYKEVAAEVLSVADPSSAHGTSSTHGAAAAAADRTSREYGGEWAHDDADAVPDLAVAAAIAAAAAAAAAGKTAPPASSSTPPTAAHVLCSSCFKCNVPVPAAEAGVVGLDVVCGDCSSNTYLRQKGHMAGSDWGRVGPRRGSGSSYLPLSHLNLHIQHMEGMRCPPDLLGAVRRRAVGFRLLDPEGKPHPDGGGGGGGGKVCVTQQNVVQMIAAEGFQSMAYAYAAFVRSRLWNTPLYTLTPPQKLLVRKAFIMHRIAYFKLSKDYGWGVKNGPPIQFLCYKLGELLGFTGWAHQCRLYGTTDHRNLAEQRWEMVRALWQWPYYPTQFV